jgi:phosphopantothenoylcysteine decarboxylase/phosphopantothenate--cysteine ligase
MWENMATQANCTLLGERGIRLLGPDSGGQACGETGPGRMLEPAELVAAILPVRSDSLAGRRVVVTAGPTYEDIDPVRYIGNRSSGRMGFALAAAAAAAGARVDLVAGPVRLETPAGVSRTDVRSAVEMRDAALRLADGADVFIGVAAVADYAPARPAAQKIKKGRDRQQLELVANPDIVAEVSAMSPGPFTVGFAAETENLRSHALEKLSRKRLDMIAANHVGLRGTGFDAENNEILLLLPGGEEKHLGEGSKPQLARLLVDEIAVRLKGIERIEIHSDKDTRLASGN